MAQGIELNSTALDMKTQQANKIRPAPILAIIFSAVGLLGAAQAQTSSGTSNTSATTAPAVSQKLQVFETSPELRKATEAALATANNPAPAAKAGDSQPIAAAKAGDSQPIAAPAPDVAWLLDFNTRPWPIAHSELNPLNALYLSTPSERDARIMLPGAILDTTDGFRSTISRFITDNIGAAAQARCRQLEAFNSWTANTTRQKTLLDKNPWAAYQFNKEARATVADYKAKIRGQSEPNNRKMAQDINDAVSKITPLMAVMGSYEQKMQWYNLLVQLKEGMGLYQARVIDGDSQILAAIEAFETANPPMAQPNEPPPTQPSVGGPSATPTLAPKDISLAQAPREVATAPKTVVESGYLSGGVVLGIVGLMVLGFFWYLRKRVAKKTGGTPPAAN